MFFTCQVSAFKLQSFSCNDLANDKTAKTVFSHLNKVQRDWQNLLIIWRACYIENLDTLTGKNGLFVGDNIK